MNLTKASTAVAGVAAVVALALAANVEAVLITNGFTFAVASDGGADQDTGSHFHSNTGGVFGNPAGKAEVGAVLYGGSERAVGVRHHQHIHADIRVRDFQRIQSRRPLQW